ncbi:hypothetical protein O181_015699 [Austropuccinia psidii MF-1]|uniref:Uncharacterized protein n=1 Tax=Austropuccinia psidii MF-1 TaxID=1389203 RepID=A0A9Q3C2G9_9BASI|nr:hypothetical protein [Austropuccinia psidii MF-1]
MRAPEPFQKKTLCQGLPANQPSPSAPRFLAPWRIRKPWKTYFACLVFKDQECRPPTGHPKTHPKIQLIRHIFRTFQKMFSSKIRLPVLLTALIAILICIPFSFSQKETNGTGRHGDPLGFDEEADCKTEFQPRGIDESDCKNGATTHSCKINTCTINKKPLSTMTFRNCWDPQNRNHRYPPITAKGFRTNGNGELTVTPSAKNMPLFVRCPSNSGQYPHCTGCFKTS